jgi:ABC-type bacteriocin/lantibiotic exporter with double-glycine peptidase domain
MGIPTIETRDKKVNSLKTISRLARRSPKHATGRIPTVRQLGRLDCGAAALAMVLRFNGIDVSLGELIAALGVSKVRTNAAAIIRTGRIYGLSGRGVYLDVHDISHVPTGSILYWESRHFVVLEAVGRNEVRVVDPSLGRRSIPIKQFNRSFSKIAVIFETDKNSMRSTKRFYADQKSESPGIA